MNKKIIFALVIVILASSGVAAAIASGKSGGTQDLGENRSFYELSYDRATDEQREQLDAILADDFFDLPGEWIRPVLIVLGDLPADTPRLTVQEAAVLYDTLEYEDLETEFNKIAGAPDWVGGSGIGRSIYFLNDERTEALLLELGNVFHVLLDESGATTTLPDFGKQNRPSPGPSPSAAPATLEMPEVPATPAPTP